MTAYSDAVIELQGWVNREDYTEAQWARFFRMGEERINDQLRIGRMIQIDTGTVSSRMVLLPDDWLSTELIRLTSTGRPLRYKSRDEFYNLTDANSDGYFTVVGHNLVFGGTPDTVDGIPYELHYFGKVPPFLADPGTATWLWTYHSSLYIAAVAFYALAFEGDVESAAGYEAALGARIEKLNEQYLLAKSSGSRLTRTRTRSFG